MVTLGRDQTQTAASENEDVMKLNNNKKKTGQAILQSPTIKQLKYAF